MSCEWSGRGGSISSKLVSSHRYEIVVHRKIGRRQVSNKPNATFQAGTRETKSFVRIIRLESFHYVIFVMFLFKQIIK